MILSTAKRRPGTISFVRYKLGLSQQQLADSLGVSRSLVAMVETGKRKLPAAIAAIYLSMCHRAAAINPCGTICIKRGRKPARADLSFVTNSNTGAETNKNEVFAAWLQQKKASLSYLHTGLQFKKNAIEERARRFSDQLTYVTAMLNVSTELLHKLPEGQTRDKYELKAATFYAKQIKLNQQLKKCGPVAQLHAEYQMRKLEMQITMTEKWIGALSNGGKGSEDLQLCLSSGIAA